MKYFYGEDFYDFFGIKTKKKPICSDCQFKKLGLTTICEKYKRIPENVQKGWHCEKYQSVEGGLK